jgi:catechol 2,3-dioxygenase-like lactoylglutathione lyase family enzyme
VAVSDLDGAGRFYREVLGCTLVKEERDAAAKAHSLYFAVGDVLMELATPTSQDSDMARHMEVHGPIVYAFAFKVKDLASVAKHCKAHGLGPKKLNAHTLELGPEQAHGGVFRFTDAVIPGHPTLGKK